MNEQLETKRTEVVLATLDELLEILKNKEADPEVRLKAAKLIDGFSDSIQQSIIIEKLSQEDSSTKHSLIKSINKLHKSQDSDEDE